MNINFGFFNMTLIRPSYGQPLTLKRGVFRENSVNVWAYFMPHFPCRVCSSFAILSTRSPPAAVLCHGGGHAARGRRSFRWWWYSNRDLGWRVNLSFSATTRTCGVNTWLFFSHVGVGHVFGLKWMFGYFEAFFLWCCLFVCFSVIEARGRPRGVKKPRGPKCFLEK